ncbi:MAG TPA: right-handed parallel beta-helix repeat-containing protein [Pirellulales bacterium]|nr:right-handed parallel beta-helix repeat-containing protein [Pirellulales bacterium]
MNRNCVESRAGILSAFKTFQDSFNRRRFLLAGGALAAVGVAFGTGAEEPPPVTEPRATSGDDVVEPDWKEKLTITVGPGEADLVGKTDRVLQAAVDYVARLGGGTVQILPGTYVLRNAVYLQSKVRLLGSGEDSILVKAPSVATKLSVDSDWYDQEITLADAKGFVVGDGICLRTRNPHHGGTDVAKRTLVARDGNRFKLDRALRQNFWTVGETTVSTLFPLLTGENISGIHIENLVLDGDKQHNDNLDGNYAGCIFLQDCQRIAIRGVTARNYNGDGISWQICHDVTVENCRSYGNTGLGLHPGSGSQRPVIRGNRLEGNDIGIFFCWGVKYGLAEKNVIRGNRRYGVSIGHRDTHNVICDNDIAESGETGVLFRPERGKEFAPHRNRLERNRIVDSGTEKGIGVDVQGQTEAITIARNEIRETRQPLARIGVRIGSETRDVTLADNRIEGFSRSIEGPQVP